MVDVALTESGVHIILLELTYKPHYHYQNFSPLANRTDLNRDKYAISQSILNGVFNGFGNGVVMLFSLITQPCFCIGVRNAVCNGGLISLT